VNSPKVQCVHHRRLPGPHPRAGPDGGSGGRSPDPMDTAKANVVRKTVSPAVAEVLRSLAGAIEPVKTPLAYRLGLILVAALMVLLPVLYAGLVVLAGYGFWLYVCLVPSLLGKSHGGSYGTVAILAPLGAGIALIAFMLKPLIPKRRVDPPHLLTREAEPVFFEFADAQPHRGDAGG
jgi:hypothetical protein